MSANDRDLVDRWAKKHSISPAGVQVVLAALRSGGGRMAQFSHADFGGMSQWSPGMSMVGDMFNTQLKAKLDALCTVCVPKIRFCNINGEGRQGQVVRRRRRGAQSRDGEGRPCSEIDGSSTHYNRRHIRVGSGAGALCGRDIRGGSSR